MGDKGQTRVRAACPGQTRELLCEIKARFDLTNLFRLNQNFLPSK